MKIIGAKTAFCQNCPKMVNFHWTKSKKSLTTKIFSLNQNCSQYVVSIWIFNFRPKSDSQGTSRGIWPTPGIWPDLAVTRVGQESQPMIFWDLYRSHHVYLSVNLVYRTVSPFWAQPRVHFSISHMWLTSDSNLVNFYWLEPTNITSTFYAIKWTKW